MRFARDMSYGREIRFACDMPRARGAICPAGREGTGERMNCAARAICPTDAIYALRAICRAGAARYALRGVKERGNE